jgi:hypothetical protein
MKSALRVIALFATVATLAASLGCSNSGGAGEVAKTLYQKLGDEPGVARLASLFGANLAASPDLATKLDAPTISTAETGLTNDIMKASAMSPKDGTTLESALKDKGLDSNGIADVNNAIIKAGKTLKVDRHTMNSLEALIKPLGRSVLEAK